MHRFSLLLAGFILAVPVLAQDDLSDYRTLDKAISAKVGKVGKGPPLAGYLGIAVKRESGRLIVADVQPTSPGDKAGILVGDMIRSVDGVTLLSAEEFRDHLQGKGPGADLNLEIERNKQAATKKVTLGATSRPVTPSVNPGPIKGKKGVRPVETALPLWKKERYRLAVVVIEYSDIQADDMIPPAIWTQAFFSKKTYINANGTGQRVFGSLNDYFIEQSYGKFHLEGKVFAPVRINKKRSDYAQGSGTTNKTVPLTEALNKLIKRDGDDALNAFDGIAFIYAGPRVNTNRGNLYYPHRETLTFKERRIPYILCPEGGMRMESIGTFALEFAKLLGLPELAARTDNPGSEGLGVWCLMSNGAGTTGRPSHLSAWCKEQLGWLNPVVIDPTVKQKLILAPVLASPSECVKVLVRSDGSEYFLLENRPARSFDADLPGQGMLVWRVLNNRPILEESHGITGPSGPRAQLDAVPFPSKINRAFTPLTTPSSRALSGGGLPVHITNIRRLPDGRITFFVGYEFF